uniref:BRCT domain-containing protein n=1 Tax=Syphacia muris TaxID=451379 RepID=A0A0N5ASJ7_9BILA
MVYCEHAEFEDIPVDWPSSLLSIHLNNCSLQRLQKYAFRNYRDLEELVIENCRYLTTIEKQAFKGLRNLSILRIENNPQLKYLLKGSFSHISSEKQLKVRLINNAFDEIIAGSFRQLSSLRELSISSNKCLHLKAGSFSGVSKIDFFNLKGLCSIEPLTFKNATRIYRINISNSLLNLTKGSFFSLAHSNEVRLENNEILLIDVDAFYGLNTVERVVIVSNKINQISSQAFSSVVNIGDLVIEENEIKYLNAGSLQSTAWRTKFRDNYVECNCANQWIKYVKDIFLLKHNFCGAEEGFRTLMNYTPNCQSKKENSASYQTFQTSMQKNRKVPCLLQAVTDVPSTSSTNVDEYLLSELEELELEEKLCNQSQFSVASSRNGTGGHSPSPTECKATKEVRVYVDVSEPFDKSSLQNSLRELGASVLTNFGKDVTHLVFWNGLQSTLDEAYENETCSYIVAPQWIKKCVSERKFVDEKPYCLYGLKGLALPIAEMAKGRVGRISEMSSARKRSAVISALEQSVSRRHCKRQKLDDSEINSDIGSPIGTSSLIYTIEAISDQLAPALASLENKGIPVTEVMTPLFDRIKRRVEEINSSDIMLSPTTSKKFTRFGRKLPNDSRINQSCPKRSPPIFDSAENSPTKLMRDPFDDSDNQESLESSNSTRSKISVKNKSISSNALSKRTLFRSVGSKEGSTPQAEQSCNKTTVTDLTRSEPGKRRGRPWISAEKMTPLQFEKAIFRRCPKMYRQHLKMNFDERREAYQKYLDRELRGREEEEQQSDEPVAKPRPVAVKTKSRVLNDLQVINSSEEFVHSSSQTRSLRRKPGNIVLSAIGENDREFLYAIVRRLGILRFAKNVDDETRFVIGDDQGSRTLNIMLALVNGIPIVSKEWAYRSLDNMSWLSSCEFLLPKWKTAYKAYRKGHLQQLFSDFGPFYVSNHCSPPALHLSDFIEKCGGKVIESLSRAAVFIAPSTQWEELKSRLRNDQDSVRMLPESWILGMTCEKSSLVGAHYSIVNAKLCPFEQHSTISESSEASKSVTLDADSGPSSIDIIQS